MELGTDRQGTSQQWQSLLGQGHPAGKSPAGAEGGGEAAVACVYLLDHKVSALLQNIRVSQISGPVRPSPERGFRAWAQSQGEPSDVRTREDGRCRLGWGSPWGGPRGRPRSSRCAHLTHRPSFSVGSSGDLRRAVHPLRMSRGSERFPKCAPSRRLAAI